MKQKRSNSLGVKLVGLTSTMAIVVVLALTSLSIYRERWNFRQDLINRTNLLLRTSAYSIRDPLYQLKIDELADYARIVDENPEVTLFIVYDAEGKILVDSNVPETIIFSQTVDKQGLEILNLPTGEQYQFWEKNQLVVGQPVILGNQTIGAIATALSTQQLDEKIAEITRQGLWLAIAAITAGILAAILVARQIIIPLRDLADVATAMTHGDLSTRVKTNSNDEISFLAGAFNQMADAIQQRESDLRQMTNKLEQTVEIRTAELREKTKILEELATTDHLTKAHNRRYFFEIAYYSIEHAKRYGEPVSIILFDADNFKTINDTYGHQAGDEVLIQLVKICQKIVRKSDIFARYGGEEFVILMPKTNKETAYKIAERLRTKIAKAALKHQYDPVTLTISLGIAHWSGQDDIGLDELVAKADKALYQAKQAGRNRTSICD